MNKYEPKPFYPYVILFNGPPKNGKDTIAKITRTLLDSSISIPTHLMHFATPMRDMAMGAVGEKGFDRYNEIKDIDQPAFARAPEARFIPDHTNIEPDCDSIRQFMIALSEDFMKRRYGKDVWGRILRHVYAPWWGKMPAVIIIPDLGFPEEYKYLLTQTLAERVMIVQVHRGEDDWKNDSREWVFPQTDSLDTPIHPFINLDNNGTPDEAAFELFEFIRDSAAWNLGWNK